MPNWCNHRLHSEIHEYENSCSSPTRFAVQDAARYPYVNAGIIEVAQPNWNRFWRQPGLRFHLSCCSSRNNDKTLLYTSKLLITNILHNLINQQAFTRLFARLHLLTYWYCYWNTYWLFINHMCILCYFSGTFLLIKKSFPQSYPQKMCATLLLYGKLVS